MNIQVKTNPEKFSPGLYEWIESSPIIVLFFTTTKGMVVFSEDVKHPVGIIDTFIPCTKTEHWRRCSSKINVSFSN